MRAEGANPDTPMTLLATHGATFQPAHPRLTKICLRDIGNDSLFTLGSPILIPLMYLISGPVKFKELRIESDYQNQ